jgi:ATP-dependent protease ClpP protease subunit
MKENKKKKDVPSNVQLERFKRSVFLPSEITEQTYGQLAPRIIELRNNSSEAICLYIHCYGGIASEAEQIMRLIRAPKQDGSKCGVTTVCIGVAASAAADLLSAGDYAIAYNDSIIHVHGTRGTEKEITVDNLPLVEASLRQENEYFAMKLASKMFRRFATRV